MILLQIHQHLAESLLARAARAAAGALARDVNQLGDALPAGAAGGGIFPVGEELLGIGAGLRAQLVGLVVVGDVEIVDVLVGLLDRRFLLLLGELGAAGDVGVASRAPFPDTISSPSGAGSGCRSLLHRFGLLLGLLVTGVAGGREGRAGSSDGAAGSNLLFIACVSKSHFVKKLVGGDCTSFCVSMAGNDDSNPETSAATGLTSSAPPSRLSLSSFTSATWSWDVANCSASSPRAARSRARKSSLSSAVLVSTTSVWPGIHGVSVSEAVEYGRGRDSF